jgi:hypothetical protein
MIKKILFADTNGFLQVRDLKDLAWRDLFPDVDAIDIMVSHPVIQELDRQKTSTNDRRRNRARLALGLIERASSEAGFALVLRSDPIQIRVVLSHPPRFDWSKHPTLDSSKADDQLVAEVLSYGDGAELFSHDTGPRIRARMAGIKAHEPLENWLLPAEQTDDQRKISKLERDLLQTRSRYPTIVADFENVDPVTRELALLKPVLQPLEAKVIKRLKREYLALHPRGSIAHMTNRFSALGGVSQYRVDEYMADYSQFERDVHEYFSTLHETANAVAAALAVDYWIKNDSGVAAEGLRIEFELDGAACLLADREDAMRYIGSLKMPEPPESPRSSLEPSIMHRIPTLRDAMEPRDPIAFHWYDRPTVGSTQSAQQCENFRATREFRDVIFIFPVTESREISVRLHVSAANLPEPISKVAKLSICEEPLDWSHPVVDAMLPIDFRGRITDSGSHL